MSGVAIRRWCGEPPEGLFGALREAASAEGYRFLNQLDVECAVETGIFRQLGSALFFLLSGDKPVGIGGLSVDPYETDPSIFRVRHVYIHPDFRRHGVGKMLAQAILAEARLRARLLTLRAPSPDAARFWEAVGFTAIAQFHRTHEMILHEGE